VRTSPIRRHTVTITDNDAALILSQPSGTLTTSNGNPTYIWNDTGADSYFLAVWKADFSTLVYWGQNLARATYCNGGTCSIDPTIQPAANESARLVNGSYKAYLCTWNCTVAASYTGPFDFSLNVPVPTPPTVNITNTNTLTPTFTWQPTGAGANVSSFQIYLVKSSELAQTAGVIFQHYSCTAVCGSPTGTTCSLNAPTLQDNTNYYFVLQSYGPGGASVGGPFSNGWGGQEFRVDVVTDPALPVLSPVSISQGVPVISFTTDGNTTHHSVAIYNWSTFTWAWFKRYEIDVTEGLDCIGGTCVLVDYSMKLGNGNYSVYVNGEGSGGVSTGGLFLNGYTGPISGTLLSETDDFTINLPAPALVIVVNATISGGNVQATWTRPTNATRFNVWVGTATGVVYYFAEVQGPDMGCGTFGSTCTFTRTLVQLGAPTGTQIYVAVQAVGPGGFQTTGGIVNNGYQVSMALNVP
jgi:hypothetical protein